MNKKESHKNKLLRKISSFLKKKNERDIAIIGIKSFGIVLLFLTLLSTIEYFSYLHPSVKIILIICLAILSVTFIAYFLWKPILNIFKSHSIPNIEIGAKEIGEKIPNIKDNLLNTLQVINNEKNSSKELANAAFESTYNKIKDYNFNELINYSTLKKIAFQFFVVFFILLLIFAFTPLKEGIYRLTNFNTEFIKPSEFSLKILTGNKTLRKGEKLLLNVLAEGEIPKEINIFTKASNESEFVEHRAKADSNNIFSIQLNTLNHSIEYFAQKDDITTDKFLIKITSPPIITSINFEIVPPRYSNLPKELQSDNGNITALKGAKVNYNFRTSKNLLSAIRKTENNMDSLKVENKKVTGTFGVYSNEKYSFNIIDSENNSNEHPIIYTVKVLQDQFPEIKITRPEQISLIPSNDIVSINYSIRDDYGFSKVLLKHKTTSGSIENNEMFIVIELPLSKKDIEQNHYYNWDVSRLGLRENETISYYLEVFDNDNVSGPKSTKTPLFKLRVPTLNELFAEAEATQENAIDELAETLEEAEELKNELKQISDELKQNEKKIEWSEKERIEDSMKKFEELADKIDNTQEKLEEMRKQMAENDLLSEETMQKYNELQDLMDELGSEEMRKAMQEMQQSLDQLMRDKVQQSLENLSFNEEVFQKSIERTLTLLKKIQIEQKVDELIKRAEKLNEDLEKLNEETKKSSENNKDTDNNELANDQKDVGDQLNSLEKEMQKLQEKMNDISNMPVQKMEKMNKEFSEQKNQELSQEAQKELQENNPFDALKNQQQISENMNSMQNQMQQMQQQMQQQSQQMVMQNMLKAIDNILDLSKEQELLADDTKSMGSQPRKLPQMAQQQMDIKQNLDKVLQQLSDLSQNTFAITPEMGEALGKARNNMNQAINGMQERNGQQSTLSQGNAMGNLNEAASMLQNSLQAMMQGGGQGSGGMMSLMQQLQQMAQQQMGLNKMTQMMQQGQLSMQQQAQLQRLAQEQGAIQKSLQELNNEAREAGQSKKLSSNLEKILDEMKEVVSGLNTKKLDDNLINKQEKILSKLLDAQRSINERDFEKNRESFSGKNFNLNSPEDFILLNEEAKNILREELLKSIKEGYSKDYQDLIKRYYENLEKIEN